MSAVTITFTDADNGVSVHCDWGTDGYLPESHAHGAAMHCIRIMDEACESKSEPVITQAAQVEADIVDAMSADKSRD